MTDYIPKYLTVKDVRCFFTPPLDYDDISTAEILLKIESVEDFVKARYFNDTAPTAEKVRIPCLLLIASKIILNPTLAKKYYTLSKEVLGDYSYELASQSVRSNTSSSPLSISITWEQMALEMLDKRSTLSKWGMWIVND